MKIKNSVICIMITAACLLCGCQKVSDETVQIPVVTGTFDFTVLKAGQADAIFMQTENHNIVIDCGEKGDGDKLVELLQEKGVSNIDYLFITHFDKDHVGGFPKVMENVAASNIIVPDYEGNNDEYEKYVETVNDKNLVITALADDTTFTLDDVLFEVSSPKKKAYAEGDNDFSLVISVTHGENTFLFAGDAEKDRLTEVLTEFGKQYDFLKVPHHGKFNSVTQRFINTVKPKYAIVTDSDKNPAELKTTAVLQSVETEIYSTRDGDILIFSDGEQITIYQ